MTMKLYLTIIENYMYSSVDISILLCYDSTSNEKLAKIQDSG
jgi:hypothetical protein